MLPHALGEQVSIAAAFAQCHLGLHQFDRSLLDSTSQTWVTRLEVFMNTSGLSDPKREGLWTVKAKTLNTDEKNELSNLIDELAHWFNYTEDN